MLRAADALLRERGTDDFTLAEVCTLGRVSIGSIYFRFSSKDELVRAVHERVMADLDATRSAEIARALEESTDLPDLIARLIERTAETLREFAPILRPLMLRSVVDAQVYDRGQESYRRSAQLMHDALLQRRDEITHPDPEKAVAAAYTIAYAALGRFLGFGSPGQVVGGVIEWDTLKRNVTLSCAAFLMVKPELAKRLA
jgi:AcrR family transcriptional regulator